VPKTRGKLRRQQNLFSILIMVKGNRATFLVAAPNQTWPVIFGSLPTSFLHTNDGGIQRCLIPKWLRFFRIFLIGVGSACRLLFLPPLLSHMTGRGAASHTLDHKMYSSRQCPKQDNPKLFPDLCYLQDPAVPSQRVS
jgi:hypothetical protein